MSDRATDPLATIEEALDDLWEGVRLGESMDDWTAAHAARERVAAALASMREQREWLIETLKTRLTDLDSARLQLRLAQVVVALAFREIE